MGEQSPKITERKAPKQQRQQHQACIHSISRNFRPYQNNVIARINPLRTQFIDSNDDNKSTHTGPGTFCWFVCVFFPSLGQTVYRYQFPYFSSKLLFSLFWLFKSLFIFTISVSFYLSLSISLHRPPLLHRVPSISKKPLPIASFSYIYLVVCWFLLSYSIRRDHTRTHYIFKRF